MNHKKLFLALALMLPLQYTSEVKPIDDDTKALLIFGGILASPFVIAGGYFLYQKIRLALRSDEQVYMEAEQFLREIPLKYSKQLDLLYTIKPELNYQQTKGIHDEIVLHSNIHSFFNAYPLVAFSEKLTSVISYCDEHKKWLHERIVKMDADLEKDIIEQFTKLANDIHAYINPLITLKKVIVESPVYLQQWAARQALANSQVIYIR